MKNIRGTKGIVPEKGPEKGGCVEYTKKQGENRLSPGESGCIRVEKDGCRQGGSAEICAQDGSAEIRVQDGSAEIRAQDVSAEICAQDGSARHTKAGVFGDIAGQKFRRLLALYPTDQRTKKGNVIWHCRCDCGNEIDVSYNKLMYSHVQSCGCVKKEHNMKLPTYLNHVEGTSIEAIKSKKIPTDNTTGYRGVYNVDGRFLAKIVFQKKQYYLGKYDTIEEAVEARKMAEETLFDSFAVYYEKWKTVAKKSLKWANDNPIQIKVSKQKNDISVVFLPDLSGILPDAPENLPDLSGAEGIVAVQQ